MFPVSFLKLARCCLRSYLHELIEIPTKDSLDVFLCALQDQTFYMPCISVSSIVSCCLWELNAIMLSVYGQAALWTDRAVHRKSCTVKNKSKKQKSVLWERSQYESGHIFYKNIRSLLSAQACAYEQIIYDRKPDIKPYPNRYPVGRIPLLYRRKDDNTKHPPVDLLHEVEEIHLLIVPGQTAALKQGKI